LNFHALINYELKYDIKYHNSPTPGSLVVSSTIDSVVSSTIDSVVSTFVAVFGVGDVSCAVVVVAACVEDSVVFSRIETITVGCFVDNGSPVVDGCFVTSGLNGTLVVDGSCVVVVISSVGVLVVDGSFVVDGSVLVVDGSFVVDGSVLVVGMFVVVVGISENKNFNKLRLIKID
jgi:hypothetical protein